MSEAALFPQKVIIYFIDCLTFLFLSYHFITALDLNPECIAVPVLVPLRQKGSVPSGTGSGSTTLGEFFFEGCKCYVRTFGKGLRAGLFDPLLNAVCFRVKQLK
jgi:hypothetical protein